MLSRLKHYCIGHKTKKNNYKQPSQSLEYSPYEIVVVAIASMKRRHDEYNCAILQELAIENKTYRQIKKASETIPTSHLSSNFYRRGVELEWLKMIPFQHNGSINWDDEKVRLGITPSRAKELEVCERQQRAGRLASQTLHN